MTLQVSSLEKKKNLKQLNRGFSMDSPKNRQILSPTNQSENRKILIVFNLSWRLDSMIGNKFYIKVVNKSTLSSTISFF